MLAGGPCPLPAPKPVRLAKRINELDADTKTNNAQITELVQISEAPPLLQETGVGAVPAAICLTAWSHQGRVRPEAAFASLAGVNPIPASSGNSIRHRLNRGGDRALNKSPAPGRHQQDDFRRSDDRIRPETTSRRTD
jgi:transposase